MNNPDLAKDVKEFIPKIIDGLNEHFKTNICLTDVSKHSWGSKYFTLGEFKLKDNGKLQVTFFCDYKKVGGRKKRAFRYRFYGFSNSVDKKIIQKNLVEKLIFDLEFETSVRNKNILSLEDEMIKDIIE